ncbi:MAG: MFS transporter [Lachnospiraceae bacterium]|nr:MFS transporter [Lachnospiraceae bacterium]
MIHLLLIIIYISFISLGLPDGLLGSAWPSMYENLNVPVSFAGIISMIISGGTVVSALCSERLVKKFGTGLVTAISVVMTTVALFGFSMSGNFWQLCLWSIPYGLGAGSVDAALNNFVALHYKSRHMSWLHCFWGVGCMAGPYALTFFLTRGMSWNYGYLSIFILQIVLTVILVLALPLWKQKERETMALNEQEEAKPLGLKKTVGIHGVKEVMITFLCYCSLEQTAGLWAVSYIVLEKGMDAEVAAKWGALFYIGITVGRFFAGFISDRLGDKNMIRLGITILIAGMVMIFLPFGNAFTLIGLVMLGLGCAPIYPCLIHATPDNFGKDASQAVIGVQMASAYVGTTITPTVFGWIAEGVGIGIFPIFLSIILVLMFAVSERLNGIVKRMKN